MKPAGRAGAEAEAPPGVNLALMIALAALGAVAMNIVLP